MTNEALVLLTALGYDCIRLYPLIPCLGTEVAICKTASEACDPQAANLRKSHPLEFAALRETSTLEELCRNLKTPSDCVFFLKFRRS